jgi:preprotein translocase SecE subunit
MALKNFIKSSYEELKKVDWPSRSETVKMVIVVVGFSLAIAILLGAADAFFTFLLRKFVL